MLEKVDKKGLIKKLGYILLVLTLILILIYFVQFIYAYTKSKTRARKVSPELELFLKESLEMEDNEYIDLKCLGCLTVSDKCLKSSEEVELS